MFKLFITGDLGFEFWMDVPGYEGLYQASTYGRVRSLTRKDWMGRTYKGTVLKPIKRGNYLRVSLCKDGVITQLALHRVVASTFLPKGAKPDVDHKDTDTSNCRVENLRWVTKQENSLNPLTVKHMLENRDAKGGKRASRKVYCFTLDGAFVAEYPSIAEASRQNGIRQSNVWCVLTGRYQSTHNLVFSYQNEVS